ncbi:MAG: hypothetical protein RLZZ488_2839 [Pseudomonadota bacterium]
MPITRRLPLWQRAGGLTVAVAGGKSFLSFSILGIIFCTSCKPPADSEEQASASRAAAVDPVVCQYSWEEKPGTTDYTTYDSFARRSYSSPDRPQNRTLIGSKVQAVRTMCQRAKFLKNCFEKAVIQNPSASAKNFRAWAGKRGIHPVLALMAKTEQETKMGSIPDSCRGGSCNGIGIGQIITAFDESGRVLSSSDRRWDGITFNVLTNLNYSVRVLSDKTSRAGSLWDLAYRYNGSNYARMYADKVVGFYSQLKSCGLY